MTFKPSSILATAVIPWDEKFIFDESRFTNQVARLASGLTRHVYIFGTAGEGYAVTDQQFQRIASCFARCAAANQVRPMIGVISLSLGTIIERIEFGRALGIKEFQLSLPCWGALNDTEVDRFFAETCGRFADCHFLHYNNSRSKRMLTAPEYLRLADRHPNLVAVKTGVSDPAILSELLKVRRLRFYFTEFGYAAARANGAECGLLISLSSANSEMGIKFATCATAEREAMLADIKNILASLHQIAGGRYHMDGGYDKLLWSVHDPDFPLRMLPPYSGPEPEDAAAFRRSLPAGWLPPA